MIGITSRKSINSYEELINYIKAKVEDTQEIRLESIEWDFSLDFNKLLRDCGLAKIVVENDEFPEIEADAIPITMKGVACTTLSFIGIRFKSHLYITGISSEIEIDSLHIADCQFPLIEDTTASFGLLSLSLSKLTINDCCFNTSVIISNISVNENEVGAIEILDCKFKNSISLTKINMPNKESKLEILGGEMEISGDLCLNDCLIAGEVDIRAIIHGSLLMYGIGHRPDGGDNIPNSQVINKFILHEATIDKAIRFMNCIFSSIDILNSYINNVYEYNLSYNILLNDTPMILRDAAIKNNNVFLIQRYTAAVYDRRLREGGISTIKRLFNTHNESRGNRFNNLKALLYKVVLEPIILLLTSFSSGERLLLWLNKYSNNFNGSWIRGVWFTVIATFVFYFILNYYGLEKPFFIVDWKFNNFGNVSEGYLSLLDIFNLSNVNMDFQPTILGKYIIFLSKIFIAYGIYQTIYAFYKYRK